MTWVWLSSFWHGLNVNAATVLGAAISYLCLGMPRLGRLQDALRLLTGWKSKSALARLEFGRL